MPGGKVKKLWRQQIPNLKDTAIALVEWLPGVGKPTASLLKKRGDVVNKIAAGILILMVALGAYGLRLYIKHRNLKHAMAEAHNLSRELSAVLTKYANSPTVLFHEFTNCRPKLDEVQKDFAELGISSLKIEDAERQIWDMPPDVLNMPPECLPTIIAELNRLAGTSKSSENTNKNAL